MMWISLLVSSSLIAAALLVWPLMNALGLLGVLLLAFLLIGTFLRVFVSSLVRALASRRRGFPEVAVPFCINIIGLVLALGVQSSELPIRLDFYLKLHQREHIVAQIASRKLKPNVPYNPSIISLSGPDRLLADDGTVEIGGQGSAVWVLFFMYRGMGPNLYSGFVYIASDERPADAGFGGTVTRTVLVQPHWFWIDAA